MLAEEGVTVADIHAHVRRLQKLFVDRLGEGVGPVRTAGLVPEWGDGDRGHFLTFRIDEAGAVKASLREKGVVTDHRGDRLRIGFGVYHDEADVARLLEILAAVG